VWVHDSAGFELPWQCCGKGVSGNACLLLHEVCRRSCPEIDRTLFRFGDWHKYSHLLLPLRHVTLTIYHSVHYVRRFAQIRDLMVL
jgi:hypothetical protein